jgi:4-alpha-glucanotransferase
MRPDTHRASGILLHPTSLPDAAAPEAGAAPAGPSLHSPGSGDFGASAYHFVDWLAAAGQQLWQILPLGPVGPGHSPYMSPSAFALNPLLIDLHELVAHGWLDEAAAQQATGSAIASAAAAAPPEPGDGGDPDDRADPDVARVDTPVQHGPGVRIDYGATTRFRMACLTAAARYFFAGDASREDYNLFCAREAAWLDDYALFMAIGERHPGMAWPDWPTALAAREHEALAQARERFDEDIHFWRFVQWTAGRQWSSLKRYANGRQVRIIGDLPIFVALHSADVWAHPNLFDLGHDLHPRVVAGVPPDYFSATGQLWGNPLYRWDRHEDEGYGWWIRRVKAALAVADVVRIDHFRGFAAYWEVAAGAPDAIDGRWVPGPGAAFFDAIKAALEAAPVAEAGPADRQASDPMAAPLPIIAEDLGVVTPDVTELREGVGLPGMRVLQFAFGDDARNPYLPHNFTRDTVAYSGTHDNDTSLGWFAAAPAGERMRAQVYLKTDGSEINWDLIHAASQSVATLAIYPLQDVLGLGSDARMNRPGDAEGCWGWRFHWSQVQSWHAQRLRQISAAHGRNGLM